MQPEICARNRGYCSLLFILHFSRFVRVKKGVLLSTGTLPINPSGAIERALKDDSATAAHSVARGPNHVGSSVCTIHC